MDRKRNRLAPLTAVRAYRLERGITLAEVALESGLTTFRLSVVERSPSEARDGEIATHRAAVDSIFAKRSTAA
jgi:hypothetical protein